jgi:hypothetical protein
VIVAWGEGIASATAGGGFLLGRRTYLDFADIGAKTTPTGVIAATTCPERR